ncbi:tetratricopeptide repeat protein [Afifella sp. H1R]|uniref:tetratricopeptide repeat protein n=1 Tax=Afifella sp. H1R TaxID=2908841 RepID=UPI001F21AF44|nr:tetratricopeptide repeat protein [Afifella sp. H1R]MCF1502437.1 tetratricopeptide repeat protein [Afifella sp. H1R]
MPVVAPPHAILLGLSLAFCSVAPAGAQQPETLYEEGLRHRLEGRFEDAARALQEALNQQPENVDALVQLGFVQLAQGKNEDARETFERVLVLSPGYGDARYGLAQTAFRNGDLEEAQSLVSEVLAAQPDNADAQALAVNIARAREAENARASPPPEPVPVAKPAPTGPSEEEIALAKRQRLAALVAEATRLRLEGRFAPAEARYRQALSLAPDDADTLVALGLVTASQDKLAEARDFFGRALRLAPSYTDARLGLARLALRADDTAEARRLAEEAKARDPESIEAELLLARIDIADGALHSADARYEALARRTNDNAQVMVGLGDTRFRQWRFDEARTAYERAYEIAPGDPVTAERLQREPPKRWRFTAGSEYSALTEGRPHWTDSVAVLSYRLSPAATVTGETRLATRNNSTDLQIATRVDYAFSDAFSANASVAATPRADFLARVALGAGMTWRLVEDGPAGGPLFLEMQSRHEFFADSEVTSLFPAIKAAIGDERLTFKVTWVHARDDERTVANGYILRSDLAATDRLRLFAGYADAPEISEGSLFETRTFFGGVSFDPVDWVTINAAIAHERRDAFERNSFALNFSTRF